MRRTALLLALGACTPTYPKPAQQGTPVEVPAEAKAEAKAEPVAAPAPAAPVEPPAPAQPAAAARAEYVEPPVDPRDNVARRAASPPSLVEPGRFHLAAYADDSRGIEIDVLGDAVVLRAPGALAVAEPGATTLRSDEVWVRGLDGFEWTWEPVPFYGERLEWSSPLALAFGGRWPDDVYFASADPKVEAEFPPEPESDPALLYKLGPDGWEKFLPETPPSMDLYYSHFAPWRDGQVIAAQVWHFDKVGFEIENGLGFSCDREEFGDDDHDSHRPKIKYPKPPRQKFVVFGGGKAPAAPKDGVAALVTSTRGTLYAFDDAGTPSRRVRGSTKWTPLASGPEPGLPREFAVAADDTLYAEYCSESGCDLHRLRGEAWAPVPLPDGASAIVGLAVDSRDDLWLAARDGLWRRKASARPPVDAAAPTDRSADAPLEAGVAAAEEVFEPWERVALPGARMPALALPRAVFGETPEDFTWHIRSERTDMSEKTHAIEVRRLRVRGDELWISASVDGAAVVLTTRAVTPFALPDFYVASPNEYGYPEALARDACPAVALRLGALAADAPDDPKLLAALEGAPREPIAVVVAADPRELVAVWTGEIDMAMGMDGDLFPTQPAQLAAAKAALTALGARLTDLGVVKQAELACWAPKVARVLATPPPSP
jgi:hypothetical protein